MKNTKLPPYVDAMGPQTRPITNQLYPSESSAREAAKELPCAYSIEKVVSNWQVGVMALHPVLHREKKGGPWRKVGAVLATCNAAASDEAEKTVKGFVYGSPFWTVVDGAAWVSLQTKQHLRSLGL